MTARQAEIDISLQARKKEEKTKFLKKKKEKKKISDFLDFFNISIDRLCLSISFFYLNLKPL